jgi:hypothetical protein
VPQTPSGGGPRATNPLGPQPIPRGFSGGPRRKFVAWGAGALVQGRGGAGAPVQGAGAPGQSASWTTLVSLAS